MLYQLEDINKSIYWNKKPPWKKPKLVKEADSYGVTKALRKKIREKLTEEWRTANRSSKVGQFHRSITKSELCSTNNKNPLREFLKDRPRKELSKLVQLRTLKGTIGSYFQTINVRSGSYECRMWQLETVADILQSCAKYESDRQTLRCVSASLSLTELLDTEKGLQAGTAFLKQLPQLLN